MPTRPTKFPRWASVPSTDPIIGGPNVQEPTEAKKNKGWERKEKPPANIQNWLHNLAYEWFQYLDFAEGSVLWGGVSTGTDPNYLVEVPHPVTAYFEGMTVAFIPNFTIGNTAQATINVKQTGESFLGAKNVRNMADNIIGGTAGGYTFGGGIAAGSVCIATFYNDEFVIVSATPRVNDPTLTAKQVMEAASNLVTYPSPGDMINHPGVAKVYCEWTHGNTTPLAQFNVSSLSFPANGVTVINFSITMASANYSSPFSPGKESAIFFMSKLVSKTTTSVEVAFSNKTEVAANTSQNSIAIFGDLA